MTTPLALDEDQPQTRTTGRASEEHGSLLKVAAGKMAEKLVAMWKAQDRLHRGRREQWKVNRARRQGIAGVMLIKRTDEQEWVAVAPPGTSKQVSALNKADRLARLLCSVMFVDPPAPDAVPATDTDEDRDTAEFSTRALLHLGSEAEADDAASAEQAFDLASTFGSGFRHWYVEEAGGGLMPLQVRAIPTAQVLNPRDPKSPLRGPDGQVVPETTDTPYVTKYVRNDWTLTLDEQDPEVKRVPVPALRNDVLKAPNVRFLPGTARDIWKARGVLIATFLPLGELRARYPGKLPMPDSDEGREALKKLVGIPEKCEDLLPAGRKSSRAAADDQNVSEDSPVFTICCYYKAQPGSLYPKGFYGCAAGFDKPLPLYQGEWYDERNGRAVDIPVDQFKQIDDEDDPYGKGAMHLLGPGNEIRNSQLGAQLEHLDRFNNRKVFYPINSSFQPRAMQATMGTYIPMSPGGEPKHEVVPDFPRAVQEMFATITNEMEHEIGLEAPVTGDSPPTVKSGVHARTQVEQVHVGISDIQRRTIRGLTRGWRIMLQLAAWRITTPQRISWQGDDGAYKEDSWTGADLGSTVDVKLQKGTLTMLSSSAKMAMAEQLFALRDASGRGVMSIEDLEHVARGNVGGTLGLQDNPHRMRVRRQIARWKKGPEADAPTPPSLGQQQPGMALAPAGQAVPMAADPAAAAIWGPTVADDSPMVAAIRYYEIERLISSTDYTRHPPPWRAAVDAEYLRMRHAAGILTVAEQQAAAQAQQAAQQQALEQQAVAVQELQATLQKQLEQATQQLAGALEERVAPLEDAITETQKAVQQLAGELEKAMAGVQELGTRVDQEASKQRVELTNALRQIEQKMAKAAQDLVKTVTTAPRGNVTIQAGREGGLQMIEKRAPDGPVTFTVERGTDGRVAKIHKEPAPKPAARPPKRSRGPLTRTPDRTVTPEDQT